MKARIIRIGKSNAIRIPTSLLKRSGLTKDVQLEAAYGRITLRSGRRARKGWSQQFKKMAATGNGKLFRDDNLVLSCWDETEWLW